MVRYGFSKKIFTKGINSDTTDEFLQDGEDRYRLNVRAGSSDGSTLGAIENVLGNTLISFTLPSGVNTVIGSKLYEQKNKNYYFVHNSLFNHCILEYNQVTKQIVKVFQDSLLGNPVNILNFSKDFLITGIDVIALDNETDLLYWTDFNEEPKKINIRKGKAYMNGDYINGYKHPFDKRILYRIKQPPICTPTSYWDSEGGNASQGSYVEAGGKTVRYTGTNTLFQWDEAVDDKNQFANNRYTKVGDGIVSISGLLACVDTTVYRRSSTPISNGRFSVLKNGVAIYNNTIQLTYQRRSRVLLDDWYDGRAGVWLNLSNISLKNGDVLTFVFNYSGSDSSGIRIYGEGLVSASTSGRLRIREQSTPSYGTNYLFKKLFRFKSCFIFDDYEESAYSSISKYSYPQVVMQGQDIAFHDNVLYVTVPTGSSIVEKIRIVGQEVNSPDFVLITEIDKKQEGIADDTFYTYKFTNMGNYVPIEVNTSIKLFDKVPLKSKAQKLIPDNRLLDGLIVEGFDPVDIDVKIDLGYISANTMYPNNAPKGYPTRPVFKDASKHQIAIVYYDHSNRSGLSNIKDYGHSVLKNGRYGSLLEIPAMNESSYANGVTFNKDEFIPKVVLSIYNEPPTWATHYQILCSKNKATGRYLKFISNNVRFVTISTMVTASYGVADGVEIDMSNILGGYKAANPGSMLYYSFQVGDRIRFLEDRVDNSFVYNEQEVLSFNESTQKLVVKTNSTTPNIAAGCLYEIFNPISNATDILYEIGECYPIVNSTSNKKIHTGAITNQVVGGLVSYGIVGTSFTGVISALTGSFVVGDTILVTAKDGYKGNVTLTQVSGSIIVGTYNTIINGNASISDKSGTIVKPAKIEIQGVDTFKTYQTVSTALGDTSHWIDSESVSFFYDSKAADFGRPNRSDDTERQVTRLSTPIWSERLVPETFINGLSSVFDTSFQYYPQYYGGIQLFDVKGDSVIMFQENKVGLVGVNQITYNDIQGGSSVGASNNVLNPQANYYNGDFGIGKHPESHARFGDVHYFIDTTRGVILRLSNDGLTPISDIYNMHNYVTDKCKEITDYSLKINIFGCFDAKFNEYIVSFQGKGDIKSETLAFNERMNFFSTFYSYYPEYLSQVNGNVISYLNGSLYLHNSNNNYNTFYGVFTASEIHSLLNIEPSNVKVFESISVESKDVWTPYEISNDNGQLTNLIEQDFQTKEGYHYAPLWKDVNTPNVLTPLIEGDNMRDSIFRIKIKFDKNYYSKLFAINYKYIISNLHNR